MSKKVQMFGRVLTVETERYTNNGAFAVSLVTETSSPFCRISVNIPGVKLDEHEDTVR